MVRNLRPASHPIKRVVLPRISFIVARSVPGNIIGCENRLPWHLKSDLVHFKNVTRGHVVILGRKTLESIGKPLPDRVNIVLSRTALEGLDGAQRASTIQDAMFVADYTSILAEKSEYFIIGGAEIYRLFEDLFNKIYLTEVFAKNISGDATFDHKFDKRSWALESEIDYPSDENNEYPFRICVYSRKNRRVRTINISNYMTEADKFIKFVGCASRRQEALLNKPKELLLDLFKDYAVRESE